MQITIARMYALLDSDNRRVVIDGADVFTAERANELAAPGLAITPAWERGWFEVEES
jgi:hypothetical protein